MDSPQCCWCVCFVQDVEINDEAIFGCNTVCFFFPRREFFVGCTYNSFDFASSKSKDDRVGLHPNSSRTSSISSSNTFSNILDDSWVAKTNLNEREKQSYRSCLFIYRKVPPFCIPRCSSLKTSAYLRVFVTMCDRACASIYL